MHIYTKASFIVYTSMHSPKLSHNANIYFCPNKKKDCTFNIQ